MHFNTPIVHKTMDLHFYWRQVCQHPWLIVTLVLVSLILGGLKVAKTRPLYQATAELLIEQNKPRVSPFEEVIPQGQAPADYQTQFEILQSRALARRVIANLGLRSHPEFALKTPEKPRVAMQSIQNWIGSLWHLVSRPHLTDSSRDEPLPLGAKPSPDAALVNGFLGRLQVKPVPLSRLVNVSFKAYDAALAARAANSLTRLYIDFSMETRFAALQDAIDWLERQVGGMGQQVEASERALQQYRDEHDVNLIDDRLPGLIREIDTLNTSLSQSKMDRIELATQYKELQDAIKEGKEVEWMPAVVENQLVQNLKVRYVDLQYTFVNLSQKYGDDHPRTMQLKAALQDLEGKIDQEVKRIVRAFKVKYQVIRAREHALRSELRKLKQGLRDLNDKSVQYGVLKREADSNLRLSDLLLNRLKETSVGADLTSGNNIRVVDPAEVPTHPININAARTISMAGMLGLVAGVGLVALMGYLDNTLKTPEEAEASLGVPIVGAIEQYSPPLGDPHELLITLALPQGKVAEAFKTLRTNLLLSYTEQPRKVFLITSPHPGDGKSTIAANLAVVAAQTERRVLLVDADLRHPSIHKIFNMDNHGGLRERLLTETYDLASDASVHHLPLDGLFVLTAGEEVPNPGELLESKRMERFVAYAREHYDMVIIDAPPVLAVSDALVLSTLVDSIVMVLRAGATSHAHARHALSAYFTLYADTPPHDDDQAPVQSYPSTHMGLVMNFFDPSVSTVYNYSRYAQYYRNEA